MASTDESAIAGQPSAEARLASSDEVPRRRWLRARRWLVAVRGHWPFLVALLLAVCLRVVVVAAYRPALWFHGDSFSYLARGAELSTHGVRPMGYGVLLRILEPLPHSLLLTTTLQHVLGLSTAVMLYALLLRHGLPRWTAALAAAPVLFDAYQLQLEHLVLSDVLFGFLVAAGAVLLLWPDRPSVPVAAGVGLLLAAAALTRSVGQPLAVVVGLALVARRVGARALLAAALAFAVPVAGYAAWFHAERGRWALTYSSGIFLYSRVMPFADCSVLPLSPAERQLRDPRPPEQRPESPRYIWDPSPLTNLPGPTFTPRTNALAMNFARTAIRHQPADYARQVLKEIGYTFAPRRLPVPRHDVGKYQFASDPSQLVPAKRRLRDLKKAQVYESGVRTLNSTRDPELAGWLQNYQRFAYVRGPVVALLVVVTVAGSLTPAPTIAGRRRRAAARLLGAVGATLILVPPVAAQFDHRYVLPALPPLAAAAALGSTVLVQRLRTPACGRRCQPRPP